MSNQDSHQELSPTKPYVYEDPFAGNVRLNSLSEREVLLRNERMSNPMLTKQYAGKSQEEMNEISRAYYIGLADARAKLLREQENSTRCTHSHSQEHQEHQAQLDTKQQYQLPLGWNERMNITAPVTDIKIAAQVPTSSSLAEQSPSEPQKDSFKEQLIKMFQTAMEETKSAQYDVRDALAALNKASEEGDETKIEAAKQEYKLKRDIFNHAQQKETALLQMLSSAR